MNIIISNANSQPIYEQIYIQIKNAIIAGELVEGEMLPSIRTLAKDLRISVVTTKRAYEELERDGYIYMVAAKGCFVAEKDVELIREMHLKEIEDYMERIIQLAPACHLLEEDLIKMFEFMIKEK